MSLVKRICYPHFHKFSTKATVWGCEHEDEARQAYAESTSKKHKFFKLANSGLVVRHDYPFLGASPDGVVSCQCCGDGVIEVKCPFNCRDLSFKDAVVQQPRLCLGQSDDSTYFLKKDHAYYYQVQAQIFLCKVAYCDFVMYSENDLVVLRVLPDPEFIKSAVEDVTMFFKLAVLPELVGKFFSKTIQGTSCQCC